MHFCWLDVLVASCMVQIDGIYEGLYWIFAFILVRRYSWITEGFRDWIFRDVKAVVS